jgi:hypothetical protein
VSRTSALRKLLGERVAVLDGAWATMFQDAKLASAGYHGERFTAHPRDLTGDPDIRARLRQGQQRLADPRLVLFAQSFLAGPRGYRETG